MFFFYTLYYIFSFFKLAYNTKLNWLVVCLLPILGEILPFYKIMYPVGRKIPTTLTIATQLPLQGIFLPILPSHTHKLSRMHWVPTFFFLKANALNTAILFTSLHVRQKWKQEPPQQQQQQQNKNKVTLLKNYKPARKYSGSVYKLIASFVQIAK